MSDYADKLRSLSFTGRATPKTTVDHHDNGTVEVTERSDGQDVTIKPHTIDLQTETQ